MTGATYFTSYSVDDIDTVSMINGDVMLHIPLYSLAQKGKLPLTFSISGNNLVLEKHSYCGGDNCLYVYQQGVGCTKGIGFHLDQDTRVCRVATLWTEHPTVSIVNNFIANRYSIVVGETDQHRVLQDGDSSQKYRAADGSGYLLAGTGALASDTVASTIPDTPHSPFDVYDSQGTHITYAPNDNTDNAVWTEVGRTDSNGNSIQRGKLGPDPNRLYIKDTLSRLMVDGPAETAGRLGLSSDVSRCPAVSAPFQPTTQSYSWQVKGSDQQDISFLFCYATVTIRTNFFGYGPGGQGGSGAGGSNTTSEVDINGLGALLLQSVVLPDNSTWTLTYDSADPSSQASEGYGDLIKITTPQGGSIAYTYTNRLGCSGSSTPGYFRALSSRTTDDGRGHVRTWDYSVNVQKEYRSVTTVTAPLQEGDSERNQTEYEFFNPLNQYGCPVVEAEQRIYQGSVASNHVIEKRTTTYNAAPDSVLPQEIDPAVTSVFPSVVTTTLGSVAATTEYPQYDPGFVAVQTYCGQNNIGPPPHPFSCGLQTDESGVTRRTPVKLGYQKRMIQRDYDGNVLKDVATTYRYESNQPTSQGYSDGNLISLPAVSAEAGSPGRTTVFSYDEANGSPQGVARGNLTSVSTSTSSGTVKTSTVFNSAGLPTTTTDGRGIETHLSYDGTGAFISSKETGGLTSAYVIDPVVGQMSSMLDPNNVMTIVHRADPLGRVTQTIAAAGTDKESWTTYTYPSTTTRVTAQDLNGKGDGSLTTTETRDGLGRTVSRQTRQNRVDTVYGANGQVIALSNPYTGTQSGAFASSSYDALNRVIRSCRQDNGQSDATICQPGRSYVSSSYLNNQVITTDERGVSWTRYYDAVGRLAQILEPSGSSTSYTYDSLGNVSDVSQQGTGTETARIRHYRYDSLARLVTQFSPEGGWTCFGTTAGQAASETNCAPTYDGDGNQRDKTDARGVSTHYEYDALNHLLSKTYSSNTLSSCFLYGGAALNANAQARTAGRLTAEWTQSGACAGSIPANAVTSKTIDAYDPMGRVLSENACVGSVCSQVSGAQTYSYDLAGNLLTYSERFGGIALRRDYDAAGRLLSVSSGLHDETHPEQLFSATEYGPLGWTKATMGSQIIRSRLYDSRMRITEDTATTGGR